MKIGLIGYGHMGREVESVALLRGHTVEFVIDENNQQDLTGAVLGGADVVVEFTRPDAAFGNIKACLEAGVPVVSGTTGWLEKLDEAKGLCVKKGGGLFYASNFSIGVNLFFELNARLANLMSPYTGYSIRIEEIHHNRKKDAPSGTALMLTEQILLENKQLKGWSPDLVPSKDQIGMTCIREGNVTGTHSVMYLSDQDKITIRHEAFSRESFATGAVSAAEFMVGRKGIYTMKDLINKKLQE
ncbi:MAG: 4-hydroxy-tetrahydrodipicolinate reductase [Bacteroidales bacterium]